MYSPKYAIETNREIIDSVIKEFPFATLIFKQNESVEALHLPLVFENEKLVGHLAKANPAWKTLDNNQVLI
jgi:transcriptional regulator